MPIREFTDRAGMRWRVWPTTPIRGNVRPQFAGGWLAFESAHERRRLAPIPAEWEELDDEGLRILLAECTPVTRDPAAAPQPLAAAGTDDP